MSRSVLERVTTWAFFLEFIVDDVIVDVSALPRRRSDQMMNIVKTEGSERQRIGS